MPLAHVRVPRERVIRALDLAAVLRAAVWIVVGIAVALIERARHIWAATGQPGSLEQTPLRTPMRALVAVASRHGARQGIAEAIGRGRGGELRPFPPSATSGCATPPLSSSGLPVPSTCSQLSLRRRLQRSLSRDCFGWRRPTHSPRSMTLREWEPGGRLPAGFTVQAVVIGRDEGELALEVVLLDAGPSASMSREASGGFHASRLGKRIARVVVAAHRDGQTWLFGPNARALVVMSARERQRSPGFFEYCPHTRLPGSREELSQSRG